MKRSETDRQGEEKKSQAEREQHALWYEKATLFQRALDNKCGLPGM